ncbi:hypothetical protein [Streptomyces roseicoloratus]|uniref:PLL-like beta propeller domain-containing protein n=1 Tax=Streptomyces roseicoloratus TaxID=2508722 RepID=A0ABY9RSP5_9ACTN|nr:hypothetical protein [Streptomyces roseicoloratus]WMX43965.1 hypothetical protein RGF97_02570 [Streptomyces roseicoloratus]
MGLSIVRATALAATTLALSGAAFAGVASAAPAQGPASAAAAHCSVSGLGGAYICEYGEAWHTFPNGTRQVFVVGTDFAVWTRFNNTAGTWSSWQSLGGTVRSGVWVDGSGTWNPTISVVGMDGERWFRHRLSSGSWTAWQS